MTELAPQDFTEHFWLLLEKSMGCIVPPYFKHILQIRGYDNPASIGTLTADDIQKIQEYVRGKLQKDNGQDVNKKMFYHAYHNDADDFEILPGHVKLLEKIVSFINSMTELHGPDYFDPRSARSVKNVRKPSQKPNSRGTIPLGRIRGIVHKTFDVTARTPISIVETQNASNPINTLQATLLSKESLVHFSNEDDTVSNKQPDVQSEPLPNNDTEAANLQSDGSLETFITKERIHLIGIIRTWMEKNVGAFFEMYSDQLVPEILESVMEKTKSETENGADTNKDIDGETVDTSDLMVLVFIFCCPKCGKKIRSTQQQTNNGETYFSLSNVERHWKIHAQENEPKKQKKTKDKKTAPAKPRARNLRSKTSSECDIKNGDFCDDVDYEVLTDEEADDPGDYKIVRKRKMSLPRKN